MEITGQRIMHDLRMRVFDHIQGLALEFFTRNPVGRLVTRVTSDVQNMYELFTSFVSFVFKDLVLLAGIAGVMLALNWKLALVTFSILPVVVFGSVRFARRARAIFRTLRVQTAEINTRFAETIGGMRVLQLFGREGRNLDRFARLNRENYVAGMEQIRVLAVFMPMIEVLAAVAVALIVWYGGGEVLRGSLSLGALVAFIAYIRMFFRRCGTWPRSTTSSRTPWPRPSASSSCSTPPTRCRGRPRGRATRRRARRGAEVRRRRLRLPAGGARLEGRELRGPPGGNRGGRGADRGGQDLARQPRPPALRPDRRPGADQRPGPAHHPGRRVPRPHGAGHAGRGAVLGHRPREHLPGPRARRAPTRTRSWPPPTSTG